MVFIITNHGEELDSRVTRKFLAVFTHNELKDLLCTRNDIHVEAMSDNLERLKASVEGTMARLVAEDGRCAEIKITYYRVIDGL